MNDTKTIYMLDCIEQLDWSGKTILIIENDRLSVFLITEYLSNTNVRLIHTTDLEALENSIVESIDIIIKGITITEFREGLSLTKRIKYQYPGIPLIAHSACVYQENIETCYRAGCDGFIAKPIDFENFSTMLSGYLEK